MATVKTLLWICLLWAPILGIELYFKGRHEGPQMDADKIDALIAQARIEGRARCIETIRKVLPSLPKAAQDRTDELLAKSAWQTNRRLHEARIWLCMRSRMRPFEIGGQPIWTCISDRAKR